MPVRTYSTAMSIKSLLTEPSRNKYPNVVFGLLGFAILLTVFGIWNTYNASPLQRHNTYGTLSVCVLLILNLLAFQIRFNPAVTAVLRILSMLWMIVVFVLLFINYTK